MNRGRDEILRLYEGLRVTDVYDGMDAIGLQDVGAVDREIKTLWRDVENFSHRICGFAFTLRYVPTQKRIIEKSIEEYEKLKRKWYSEWADPYKCMVHMQKGDVLVIDGPDLGETGFVGSANVLKFMKRGAVGVVTNGGCRDTDEVIRQKSPVYCAYIGRGVRPGRMEFDTYNVPVNIGGALVNPGDLVIADGDGVLVVPIDKTVDVALYARRISAADKEARKALFDTLGITRDFTVE